MEDVDDIVCINRKKNWELDAKSKAWKKSEVVDDRFAQSSNYCDLLFMLSNLILKEGRCSLCRPLLNMQRLDSIMKYRYVCNYSLCNILLNVLL